MKEETRIKATSEDVATWEAENNKNPGRKCNRQWGLHPLSVRPTDSSTQLRLGHLLSFPGNVSPWLSEVASRAG